MFQDRLTFRRIIVKNNAKKRKMYEAFIETLPLLTSLEVQTMFFVCLKSCSKVFQCKLLFNQMWCHPQLSERMKVVDVISSKVFSDSQQIIAQVTTAFLFFPHTGPLKLVVADFILFVFLQGDSADCFYIVESGQVRITIKRSRVSLMEPRQFSK